MAAPADPRLSRDRGSITLWAVTSAFSMIAIVGIAADLGGHAVAEQNARSVAFEAARSGGQQTQPRPARPQGAGRNRPVPGRISSPGLPRQRGRHRKRRGER